MSGTGSRPAAPTPTVASSSQWVNYDADLAEWEQLLLCDAQTSGGLLAALPHARAAEVVRALQACGLGWAAVVGSIDAGERGRIRVSREP